MTTVATPSKWLGRAAPHKSSVRSPTLTLVEKFGGYISLALGRVKEIGACGGEHRGVMRLVAGISVEIFPRAELQRIDEEGSDDAAG